MLTFKSLTLKNVVYFNHAKLDLDKPGLTVITGLNENAGSLGLRRNGAGKSLLVSGLAHLNHRSPIGHPVREEKFSLLDKPSSSLEWDIEDSENNEWLIRKYRSGKSVRYAVIKNGEELNPRTILDAENLIRELLPLTEEQFHSTVYLDSRRSSTLLHGTPVQRQTYISDLLNLTGYAEMRSWFSTQLGTFKDLNSRKAALEDQLTGFDLDKTKVEQLKKNIQALESTIETSTNLQTQLKKDIRLRNLWERNSLILETANRYRKTHKNLAEKLVKSWEEYLLYTSLRERYLKELDVFLSHKRVVEHHLGKRIPHTELERLLRTTEKANDSYQERFKTYKG